MKPTTIASLQKCKQDKKRFATITAYDYSFAKLFAEEGLNGMLVGDSLGMTVQGHDSTLPVTVADSAYHTAAAFAVAVDALANPGPLLELPSHNARVVNFILAFFPGIPAQSLNLSLIHISWGTSSVPGREFLARIKL